MTALDVVVAAYQVARPVPRFPDYPDPELVPEHVLSAGACCGAQLPDSWCYGWSADPLSDRTYEEAATWGIPAERVPGLIALVGGGAQGSYPFCACRTLDAAHALRAAMGAAAPDVCVIGIGLPRRFVAAFREAAMPAPQQPGFAPNGPNSMSEILREGRPPALGGEVLGFEPIQYVPRTCTLGASWACCLGVGTVCGALGLRTNAHGLLDAVEDACRAAAELDRIGDRGEAEPGPWFPWQIVRYETP